MTDTTTGLIWKRCAEGQTWNGTTCNGSPTYYTYDQATALTSNFAGHSDWRLPNIRELTTISDLTTRSPAIDAAAFPNTPSSTFWSSSLIAGDSYYAWGVTFANGNDDWLNRYTSAAVRLLRAETVNLLFAARPTADYVDNGDGTVTHTPTHLMWKRCAEGQDWTGSACSGSVNTYTDDQATAITSSFAGHNDWRVPTEQELRSLVDYTIADPGPTINTTIFPNTPSSIFWSSSLIAGDSYYAWGVTFANGNDDWLNRYTSAAVRLLRAGQ